MGEIIQFKKKRIPKGLIISGLGGVREVVPHV